MTSPIRQANFNGGEIAPGLHARTNLKKYSESMRLLRNMIAKQEGPVTNRPGFGYQAATYAPAAASVGRLHPFIFSSGSLANNCVLEFTPLFLRIRRGTTLLWTGATLYDATDIPRLKFAQIGQRMYIFCKQRTPRILTWTDDTTWTLTDFAITRAITAPTNLALISPPPATATVAAKLWEIEVTAVKAETKEESLPCTMASATMGLSSNTPCRYTWTAVSGAESYNIYRGRYGKRGFVGSSISAEFLDEGQGPVYAEVAPTNRNPFPGANDMPQVGAIHDQRLAVANAWNNPGEVEMSRIGEIHNFDRGSPPKATDAVTFTVGSAQYEEIRAMVSVGRNLLVMTNAMEQMITGSTGIITQDDIVWDDQPTRWGCSWLDPLTVGLAVVFLQDVGSTIRELVPLDKAAGQDLTLLARHLFLGQNIVSWCYAHEPFRVIWAVRDDGALLSCTYVRQLEMWAWARHDTGGGDLFESVCSIPEGGENAVYALVKRYVNGAWARYYEKLTPRAKITLSGGVFLDSAKSVTLAPAATAVTGLSHLEGRVVYALADGIVRGPFTVVAGAIALPVAATTVHVGLRITAQGTQLDVYSSEEELRERKKLVKRAYAEVEEAMPFKAGQRLGSTLNLAKKPDGSAWTVPLTGLAKIEMECDWDDGGAVSWEHTDPTPLTILSIIREVEFGGR